MAQLQRCAAGPLSIGWPHAHAQALPPPHHAAPLRSALCVPLAQSLPPRPAAPPGTNEGFWSSEWAKHGTCSLAVLPMQQQYFSTALQLADKYDLDVSEAAAVRLTSS